MMLSLLAGMYEMPCKEGKDYFQGLGSSWEVNPSLGSFASV